MEEKVKQECDNCKDKKVLLFNYEGKSLCFKCFSKEIDSKQ